MKVRNESESVVPYGDYDYAPGQLAALETSHRHPLSAEQAAQIFSARRHPASHQARAVEPSLLEIARSARRAFGSYSAQPIVYTGHAQLFTRKNG